MKSRPHAASIDPQKNLPPCATRRTASILAALIATGMFSSALRAAAQTAEEEVKAATVTIDNFTFSPETLTIKPGTKVTFLNRDDIPHTVVAVDKAFKSKALDTDDSYEFVFTTAGVFDYFCGLHPHMKAKIIVAP